MHRVGLSALRAVGLGLLSSLAISVSHAAPDRFDGGDALVSAGAAITQKLAYRHSFQTADFDPGLLALRWIEAYAGRFTVPVLFSPRLGHQVILEKEHTVADSSGSGRCASFALVVEHFAELSAVDRDRLAQQGLLPVVRIDRAAFHACLESHHSVRLTATAVMLNHPAEPGRLAFSRPMAIGAGTGAGGF
ncbi:MAG: hypothetical protein EAZ99_08860 [Alphaproteobacteria bacterium]|nr:MAG: hypothetical protein EAZ99_08860 [Alphaproteobacteria bacterium]